MKKFDTFYKEHRGYVDGLTRDQDLSQEVWLKVFDAFDRFNGQYAKTWLFKIVRNAAINQYKKKKRETKGIENFKISGFSKYNLISFDELEITKTMFEVLDPKRKQVFDECYLKGKNLLEISKEFSIHPKTVRSRIGRGKKQLVIPEIIKITSKTSQPFFKNLFYENPILYRSQNV